MSIADLITFIALFGFAVIELPMLFITWDDWAKRKEWEEENGK